MKTRTAFTLIELMVVISIIAILASLLFPVFSKTKSRTFLTQDVVQMRQVYAAVAMYETDSNEFSPPALLNTYAYAKSQQVYASPSDPYRNGVPGRTDFPENISCYHDLARASFRISYPYLYPMALDEGFDTDWYYRQRQDPGYGLIADFFYNDPSVQPASSQFDVWRTRQTMVRFLTTGSLQIAHGMWGTSDGCNVDGCFGDAPP